MITIIVDKKYEYDMMQELAKSYVCRHLPFNKCAGFPPDRCTDCYDQYHLECGIRVIPPVIIPIDNKTPDEL